MRFRKFWRGLSLMSVVCLGLLSLIGSNHRGTFSSDPDLGLIIANVSNQTPTLGETVTISWDYDTPEILNVQGVRIVSLLMDGRLFTLQQGCLPSYQEGQPCMDLSMRTIDIEFKGPIAVFVDAIDSSNRVTSKAVKLRIPGMSFKLSQLEFTNPGYPRFSGNIAGDIEFDKAFGIYANVNQSSDEDGVIDGIANLNLPGFDSPTPSPFFGLSYRPEENNNFGFRKGSRFPLLDGNFKATLSENQQVWESPYADGLIYAGLLAIDGDIEYAKDNAGGDVPVFVPAPNSSLEPFFVQIDLRSTDQDPTRIYISDIHLGNTSQGLVLSSYFGDFDPDITLGATGEYVVSIVPSELSGALLSSGDIKGATVGYPIVETVAGQNLLLVRAGISALWSNIPFYPNDDLSGLFVGQFQAP